MQTQLLLALALLLPLGCSRAADAPPETVPAGTVPAPGPQLTAFFTRLKAGEKQTVVAYGTSLTKYGYWVLEMQDYFNAAYPGLVTVVNTGGPGQGSNWGVANLKTRVLDHKPDLVFIEFSYNDAHTRLKTPLDTSRANLDKIVRPIREANPRVAIVLQTMNVPWNTEKGTAATDRPQMQAYNDLYRTYAKEQNLPLLDHYLAWNQLKTTDEAKYESLVPDGSHPGRPGSLLVTWPDIKTLFEKAGGAVK